MSDALKPCPFCGGEATDWEVGTFSLDSSYDMFGCEKCGIGFDTGRDSENEILWNTRAAEAAEAAIPRAYRMGLEDAAKIALALGEVLQSKWRAKRKTDTYLEGMADACDDYADAICAIPTPTDLVERVIKETE